jgi:hypothetical protein
MLHEVSDVMVPSVKQITLPGWANGNDYELASETFGVLPFQYDTCAKLRMLVYHPDFTCECKIHHSHLTQLQQTHMGILPVHTYKGKALYRLFLNDTAGHFSGKKQPNGLH